jgi:hypothetical protein
MSISTKQTNIDTVALDTLLPPAAGRFRVHVGEKKGTPSDKICNPTIVEWNGKFYEITVYNDGVEQNYADREWGRATTKIANTLNRVAQNCDTFNRANFTTGLISLEEKSFRFTTDRGETHRITGNPVATQEATTSIPQLETEFDALSLFFRNYLNANPAPAGSNRQDDDIPHAIKRLKKEDANDGQLQISDFGHYLNHLNERYKKNRNHSYCFEYNVPIAWERLPDDKKADGNYFYKEIVDPLLKKMQTTGQDCDQLLLNIPILIGNHYVDVLIDIPNKRIYYYDSFGCKRNTLGAQRYQEHFADKLDALISSLANEFDNFYTDWEVVKNKKVHQSNTVDCGVHVLDFSEAMLGGTSFDTYMTSKHDMSAKRKQIAAALEGKIPTVSKPWYEKAQFWKRS